MYGSDGKVRLRLREKKPEHPLTLVFRVSQPQMTGLTPFATICCPKKRYRGIALRLKSERRKCRKGCAKAQTVVTVAKSVVVDLSRS